MGFTPRGSDSFDLGAESKILMCNKLPGGTNAADPGHTLREPLGQSNMPHMQGEGELFLSGVLKIIPIIKCVPWREKQSLGFDREVFPDKVETGF